MAGHRKWSIVKQIKGILGRKRGKLFSKITGRSSVNDKFEHRGPTTVSEAVATEVKMLEVALEAGAET